MRRPLLVWPRARGPLPRTKVSGNVGNTLGPGVPRQARRLTPKFQALQSELARRAAQLQTSPVGAHPELVVVFDVAGSMASFRNAVRNTAGLEWLAEGLCDDEDADEEFSRALGAGRIPRRLYFMAASQAGMKEIRSLWQHYVDGDAFDRGLGAWKQVFNLLRDLRRWGRRDRLKEETLEVWKREVDSGKDFVDAEIDLWLRSGRAERLEAEQSVRTVLTAHDVKIVDGPVFVEEAGIHVLLARLPAAVASALVAGDDLDLIELTDVRAFRVAGEAVGVTDSSTRTGTMPSGGSPSGAPVIAVLDGLPLQNPDILTWSGAQVAQSTPLTA